MREKICAFMTAAALLALCACGGGPGPVETVNPYEGMVQVESGFGTKMWVELYEDVPASDFDAADFRREGGFISYTGSRYETLRGIDVSEHQGAIDWKAVASDGIDFAMIRAGYRGYSEGGLYVDAYFFDNLRGAMENDIRVGLYFFSQAVTPEEAVEEAEFLLNLLDSAGFNVSISAPVAFDWENIDHDEARTDGLDGAALTDCAIAFCERIKQAGRDAAVYAYRNLAYFLYDLPRLADYALWIGALGDTPDFYYRHEIWQYSASGSVSGIDGPVDLNLYFRERTDGAQSTPSPQPDSGGGDTAEGKKSAEAAPAPASTAAADAQAQKTSPDSVLVEAAGVREQYISGGGGVNVSGGGEVIIYDDDGGSTFDYYEEFDK